MNPTVYPSRKRPRVELSTARRFQTFRISNIPRYLTTEQFRDVLFHLPTRNKASQVIDGPNVLGWSYAPAAASSLSGRFCVATVTFHVPPVVEELEMDIKRACGSNASRVKVDLDFLGLTPLADPGETATVE